MSNHISSVSTPDAANQTAFLEGRGFQICDRLFVAANAKLRAPVRNKLGAPVRKRNKAAHIAYKFFTRAARPE
jgi:hypothetical protein